MCQWFKSTFRQFSKIVLIFMNKQIVLFLNKLKNASLSSITCISTLPSSINIKIAEILYNAGYIQNYCIKESKTSDTRSLYIFLRFHHGRGLLNDIEFISSISREKVLSCREIKLINQHKNLFIFSTPAGLLDTRDCIKKRVGGVLLCRF
jgi:ribosomal protein S8